MLGQPVSMLIPQVVGVKLTGRLREGATATDLVLTITEMLRKHGVVGKFVEYFGPGLRDLPLADRATIGNMSPEYGATCGIFPIDQETLNYLRLTGRSEEQIALVEAYCREQGLFHDSNTPEAEYSELLALDLATVEPSLAGPKRPQDRVALSGAKQSFESALPSLIKTSKTVPGNGNGNLHHGSVVIAAITSCTNTSNPSVMLAAGLLAKKAVEHGLQMPEWVKTSLAPGSKVVRDYLENAGLTPYLEKLKFHIVGYGCTTCIGNSGPLPEEISSEIDRKNLVVASVLSGNRNFEGRINPDVRANYLMSPPLVVAFALAGRIDVDLRKDALGNGKDGKPVYLADVWPTQREVDEAVRGISSDMFRKSYNDVFAGDEHWRGLPVPKGDTYAWEKDSTYIRRAPYFDEMAAKPGPVGDIKGMRVLAMLGDSVTTDHISPAGSIAKDSPAGRYLISLGVEPKDFNSYGARRGNHEVMVRGTFANVRLRNKMVPGVEGGFTKHLPDGAQMTIFEASEKYIAEGVPLVILAGKEYGSGSSRDWAAKGPLLLGVRVVIAESYERIHRSNLVGMGILPLQFLAGESAESLGLTGDEVFEITGIRPLVEKFASGSRVKVRANGKEFDALVRIDTPQEALYYANGGILQYVLRQLLSGKTTHIQ
jgi:aconitate hydratase